MRLHEFRRYPLTFGQGPPNPLRRLSEHLGGARVRAEGEDVRSGLASGENKIGKLECIVPDIPAGGADTLVSIGGYQSNHMRQVAPVAAHLGPECRLVRENWVPWEDPVNTRVGNIPPLPDGWVPDSRLDPCGDDRRLRGVRADPRASGPDRAAYRRTRRARPGPRGRRDHPPLRASRRSARDRRRPCHVGPDMTARMPRALDARPGIRGEGRGR